VELLNPEAFEGGGWNFAAGPDVLLHARERCAHAVTPSAAQRVS